MPEVEEKDFIETDEDTAVEDGSDADGIYPLDQTDTVIEMSDSPSSVYEYLRKYEQEKIITQPDFQRNLVWTKGKKSKFIESIILNFPLPAIYLNETIDGKYIVIDGLQRTTALYDFYKNKFALADLEAAPSLNSKKFKDLSPALQSKFEDKKINIYNLKPSTPMPVIYDLFNRINTGGTQLNKQEIRNCIFLGKSTRLLKELSEEKYFVEAIDGGIVDTRMKDRETILRYISFRWFDFFLDYTGNLSNYVEMAMKKINNMNETQIENIKNDFKRVMIWSYKIWGIENFRIPTEQNRGLINTAVLETVCHYLSFKSDIFLEINTEIIRNNYYLLLDNSTYNDSVTKSTGNRTKVLERFKLAHEILNHNIIPDLNQSDKLDFDVSNENLHKIKGENGIVKNVSNRAPKNLDAQLIRREYAHEIAMNNAKHSDIVISLAAKFGCHPQSIIYKILYQQGLISKETPINEIYTPLVNKHFPATWKDSKGIMRHGAPFIEDRVKLTYNERYGKIDPFIEE